MHEEAIPMQDGENRKFIWSGLISMSKHMRTLYVCIYIYIYIERERERERERIGRVMAGCPHA